MSKTAAEHENYSRTVMNGVGMAENNLPLYPEFNDKSAELDVDMVQDWMCILLQENRARIENTDDMFRLFVEPRSVQYLFTICLRMRLPHDVKYMAIGIFSEFMVSHVAGLYNMIHDLSDRSSEQKIREWEKVESTISRQMSLRIVSCIQIASKIHCYNESLSTKRVKRCLQFLGLAYTEDAVRKSELRVLMTIEFCARTRHTPVTYIESVLCVLNKHYTEISASKLWEYSLLFLDCVYLQLDEIYRRILLVIHGREAQNLPRDRMLRIQADYMLLATGVIAAACVCIYGMDFSDKVIESLGKISRISTTDILDVSTALMKTILEHKKVASTIYTVSTPTTTRPSDSNFG